MFVSNRNDLRNNLRNQYKSLSWVMNRVDEALFSTEEGVENVYSYARYLHSKNKNCNVEVFDILGSHLAYAFVKFISDKVYTFGVLHNRKIDGKNYSMDDLYNLITQTMALPKEGREIRVRSEEDPSEWVDGFQIGFNELHELWLKTVDAKKSTEDLVEK